MKRILFLTALVFLALPALASPPEILVLSGLDAPGKVSTQRIETCIRLISQDLKITNQDLPRIIVFHISKKAGLAAGVDRTTVRRNFDAGSDQTMYYEFWIVGEPRPVDYSVAVMNILENRVGQKLEQKERLAIMQRALRYLQSTVSAYGE